MLSFTLRFSTVDEFLQASGEALGTQRIFVVTDERPDVGVVAALEVVIGPATQAMRVEVVSLEPDAQLRPGVWCALSPDAAGALASFRESLRPPPLDDEPTTDPHAVMGDLEAEPPTSEHAPVGSVLDPEPATSEHRPPFSSSPSGAKTPPAGIPVSTQSGLKTPPAGIPVSSPSGLKTPPAGIPVSTQSGLKTPPAGIPVSSPSGLKTPPAGIPASSPSGVKTPPIGTPATSSGSGVRSLDGAGPVSSSASGVRTPPVGVPAASSPSGLRTPPVGVPAASSPSGLRTPPVGVPAASSPSGLQSSAVGVPASSPSGVRAPAGVPSSVHTTGPLVTAAAPRPSNPAQSSPTTPARATGPLVTAAAPRPSNPAQSSPTTPARATGPLVTAAPRSSNPAQSSPTTPARATGPLVTAAAPRPSNPAQSSPTTPARATGPLVTAAAPRPSNPAQSSPTTPPPPFASSESGLRITAAPAQPSSGTPAAPFASSDSGLRITAAPATAGSSSAPPFASSDSGLRITAAPARPSVPGQPSSSTPPVAASGSGVRITATPASLPTTGTPPFISSDSGLRITAAPARPSTPGQPSANTPSRRGVVGPLITAPTPGAHASAPPPPGPAPMPPMSAPRPIGSTSLQTAFTPRIQTNTTPALAPSSAHDGRVGRIGELMGKLGFPLSPDRVAREERARAALPSTMPIAWLLGVEWVRANDPEALGALVTLTTDIASTFGGALDLIDATGATFIFFGLGSQGACVLAAQELRERIEALADGRPDAPSLRLAVAGSRLRAEPDHAAEGDGLNALQSLLRKAQAGQCLLARNLANGVSDLVGTTPTIEEVQLSSRKPSPAGALPTVAFEPVLKLLDLRVAGLERGVVAPVVITGARRSGRTHLAFEFARRASNQKVLVGFTSSLKGERAPLSSLAELVCGLCDVPFDDRHTALGPAMEKLGVAPIRREAMLAALQLSPTPAVFTTNQVVDALRLVLADLTQGKPRVVVFDALDQADDATVEVVRVLLRTPTPKELVVVLSTPTHATSLPVEAALKVPTVSPADVETLLQAVLQTAPTDLRDVLLFRAQGLAGVVVDLLLLTLARGAIRPKGESLALEGAVPDLPVDALVPARLAAEGSRCGRLLEAVWLLGDDADAPTVAQVLPGVAQEQWPRAFASRLLSGVGGRASVAPAFAALVSKGLSGPGLATRAMQVVQASKRPMPMARAAQMLERANDAQRAGAAWRDVAERAAATKNVELTARAQEGMARVLRRHPQRDLPPVLANRMQLWARVACIRLGQGDVAAARRALNEGLDVRPRGGPADPELSYAQARVAEAEGQVDEASEALAEAFAASKGQPIRAAVLALLAQTLEAKSDPTNALDTWHQALAAAEPFLPHAPWFGEVDFRGRVEARIGALFITQTQGSRARTWLVSAAERFKAANAPLFAARVMANVGTLSMQLSSFADAAQWFGQAAATAESGGDFLFQSKQLLALSKVLARQQDPRSREVAQVALGLAEALGWIEGATQLRELAG